MDPKKHLPSESWESFDADALFPPPRLHANKVTKVDKKEGMKKVAPPEDGFGDPADSSNPEELGDTYCDAPADQKGHVDDLMEMEGLEGGTPDNRDVQADKTEDKRTQKDSSEEESAEKEASGPEPAEAKGEKAQPPKDGKEAPKQKEGAEKPIQKESEGVKEVAEATSKTSEDVHGGDEATKDIEDSPNAADDGKNPDNHGAEKGKGGAEGEGEGEGQAPGESPAEKGEGETSGGGTGEVGSQQEAETQENASPFVKEDWEDKADQSVYNTQRLYEELAQVSAVRPSSAGGGGKGVDYSGETWDATHLRSVFFRTRELIKKLLNEEDLTRRQEGASRWWPKKLVQDVIGYRYPRIPSAKFDRPKENNLVFFMDVSGSVSSLAGLFMAIMGGAAGLPGVRIVVGSEAHAENEIVVEKPFKTVEKAVNFFKGSVNAHVCDDPLCPRCKGKIVNVGWRRPYEPPFEPGVVAYLQEHGLYNANTTCIFFGDMQAVHFNVPELRKIVRTCQCLWLFTDEPGHYTHTGDLPMAIEAKLPIVYNVRDAAAFAKAVRRLQSIRLGMQIVV